MPGREKVLVVIDPTRDTQHQPALKRAIINSKIRGNEESSKLTLMVAIDLDNTNTEASNENIIRSSNWLIDIKKRVENENLSCDIFLSWSKEWAKVILLMTKNHDIDLIMAPFYKEKLTEEKWFLMRNSPVPVLMVREGSDAKRTTILAALKIQDPSYEELNKKVLDRGKWSSQRYGAEFHVVNAYDDSLEFPDRGKLSKLADVPNDHIHIRQGDPDRVIASIAKKINADMLIVGTKRRTGIKAALRSNMLEKIIADLKQDVMMIV